MQEHDLNLLCAAAREAGTIAMRHFRNRPQSWDKADGQGPVTIADMEVNEALKARLLSSRPNYGWLSEESEDDAIRLKQDKLFVIDPIDGTRSFIDGHKNFSHALATVEHGHVKAAVVYLPAKDLMYSAQAGNGAYLNGEKITHSATEVLSGARMLASSSQLKPELWQNKPPPIDRHFRSSLAYRLCLVAQGRFDGMFTLRDAWEWDIAAGDLICQEAGAYVSTRHGAEPIYNNQLPKLPGVLASAPAIHSSLLNHV